MIFVDLLKEEYIEEVSELTYQIRNNSLFQNKFDSSLARNKNSIIKSMTKQIPNKNHYLIYDESDLIGYFVICCEGKELKVNEIFFTKINKSILFKFFRFLMDYALSNLFDIISFEFNGYIFDEIIKEYLDEDNRLEYRRELFDENYCKFAIISFKSNDSLIKLLNKNGSIIVDNIYFHGVIYENDENLSRNVRGIKRKILEFIDYINSQTNYENKIYSKGDGIMVIKVKNEN